MKNQPVAKDAAFRSGDDEEFRMAKYDERRAIARTRVQGQAGQAGGGDSSVVRPPDS